MRKVSPLKNIVHLISEDVSSFRNVIVWLEDVKVRFLAMEDRVPLRAVSSPEWDATLKSVSAHFGSLMLSISPSCSAHTRLLTCLKLLLVTWFSIGSLDMQLLLFTKTIVILIDIFVHCR